MEFETTTYIHNDEIELTVAFDATMWLDEIEVCDRFVRIQNLIKDRVYDIDYSKLKRRHQDIVDAVIDDYCYKEYDYIFESITMEGLN
jgi:hypothetical protein